MNAQIVSRKEACLTRAIEALLEALALDDESPNLEDIFKGTNMRRVWINDALVSITRAKGLSWN